jgi:hypothetical protein
VATHDFTFEMALPHQSDSEAIVAELATAVLGYVGYAPDAIADLTAKMCGAVADTTARGQRGCRVAFRAQGGELQIAVINDGTARWQDVRPLP